MPTEDANPNPLSLESLVTESFSRLTAAEAKLLRAAVSGELAVCSGDDSTDHPSNDPRNAAHWGDEREIRAGLIEWLCRDRRAAKFIHSRGIQILAAKVRDVLDLSFITVEFPIVLVKCWLAGQLILQGARTRTISMQGTRVHSIVGDGADVQGAILLRDGFHAEHGVVLTGSRISDQLDCSGSVCENSESLPAFVADGAKVSGAVFLRHGFRSNGEVRFHYAQIGGDFDCSGGVFKSNALPGMREFNTALDCEGIVVNGSILLRHGFHANGLVLLHGGRISFNLDCVGGRFERGRGEDSMNGDACIVNGTVSLCDGFQAEGRVFFTSGQIGGDLRCVNARFAKGLVAERANIKGALFWRGIEASTTLSLNLLNTKVDSLSDESASWPSNGNLQLNGFVYQRFSAFSPSDAKSRINWLTRLKSFTPQPYRQLAKTLRDEGDSDGAQKVLYAMAIARSAADNSGVGAFWNPILKYTVGYGYYPARALFFLCGLVVLGSVLFCWGYSAGRMSPTDKEAYSSFRNNRALPEYYERFHAGAYSLENAFPLVKLGQLDRWQPDPRSAAPLRLFRWCQVVLGWFFTTMGIAAVTGVVRKD